LADTLISPSLLLSELDAVLRTTPPLTTRRHDTEENHLWLAQAANIIEKWDSSKGPAFADLVKQFFHPMAREANEAFRQMLALLHKRNTISK
jgi:hypothetical protein